MNGGMGPGFQQAQQQYGLVSKLLSSPQGSKLLATMSQPTGMMPTLGPKQGYAPNSLYNFIKQVPGGGANNPNNPPPPVPSIPNPPNIPNPPSAPNPSTFPGTPAIPGTPNPHIPIGPPVPGGSPVNTPPAPVTTPNPLRVRSPAGNTEPPLQQAPPIVTTPGYQPGQYGTGRAGDGSQTGLMTPDSQAWINAMLHGPMENAAWRRNMQIDPNDIIGSIERASGIKYTPGYFGTLMAPGVPGAGY